MHQLEMRHKLTTAGYPKKLHRQREETVFILTLYSVSTPRPIVTAPPQLLTQQRSRLSTSATFDLECRRVDVSMPRRSRVNYKRTVRTLDTRVRIHDREVGCAIIDCCASRPTE